MSTKTDNYWSDSHCTKHGSFAKQSVVNEEEVKKAKEHIEVELLEVIMENDLVEDDDLDDYCMYEPWMEALCPLSSSRSLKD